MNWLKSKTLLLALATATAAVAEQYMGVIKSLVGEQNFGLVMLALAIAIAILRVFTTVPISDK